MGDPHHTSRPLNDAGLDAKAECASTEGHECTHAGMQDCTDDQR
jgi:hypothetical protein